MGILSVKAVISKSLWLPILIGLDTNQDAAVVRVVTEENAVNAWRESLEEIVPGHVLMEMTWAHWETQSQVVVIIANTETNYRQAI